jgi:hypothetical protein
LGIGDWAQSPIPNPQSPFKTEKIKSFNLKFKIKEFILICIYFNKKIIHLYNKFSKKYKYL